MIKKLLEKGSLLLAEPSILGDATFARAVILVAEYNPSGAVGFILNKPFTFTLNELVPEITAHFKLYNGGPVEEDNLYFIHNVPELIPNSVEISQGIYWGGDFELTKNLINSGQLGPDNIRFFLGYSGWAADQLQEELEANSWIVTQNTYNDSLIGVSATHFWKNQLLALGGEYVLWSNAPENPQLN
jgi:putative transcriptional regulator